MCGCAIGRPAPDIAPPFHNARSQVAATSRVVERQSEIPVEGPSGVLICRAASCLARCSSEPAHSCIPSHPPPHLLLPHQKTPPHTMPHSQTPASKSKHIMCQVPIVTQQCAHPKHHLIQISSDLRGLAFCGKLAASKAPARTSPIHCIAKEDRSQ